MRPHNQSKRAKAMTSGGGLKRCQWGGGGVTLNECPQLHKWIDRETERETNTDWTCLVLLPFRFQFLLHTFWGNVLRCRAQIVHNLAWFGLLLLAKVFFGKKQNLLASSSSSPSPSSTSTSRQTRHLWTLYGVHLQTEKSIAIAIYDRQTAVFTSQLVSGFYDAYVASLKSHRWYRIVSIEYCEFLVEFPFHVSVAVLPSFRFRQAPTIQRLIANFLICGFVATSLYIANS